MAAPVTIDDEWQEEESTFTPVPPAPSRRNNYSGYERNWRDAGTSRGGRSSMDGYNRQPGSSKVITVPSQKVGRIIGKGGSKIKDLEYESEAKIKIGEPRGNDTSVILKGSEEAIAKAERMIQDLVIDRERRDNRDNAPSAPGNTFKWNEELSMINENGVRVTDWDKVNAIYDKAQKERHEKLAPLIKDFYKEDPAVKSMTPTDVSRWRRANHDIQVIRTFDDKPGLRSIPNPVLTFEQAFSSYPELLHVVKKQGFKKPSPIQSQAWPILLRGDDMIGIAQTGTGKTLAYLLPALIHIDGQSTPRDQREGPLVLILAPTRELAIQINKEVLKYPYRGIKSVCIYGGGDRREQIKVVESGVDIVIATPGRLCDLIKAGQLNAINFSYLVLDEADRMLDMGFEPQIRIALFDLRPEHQTVMTSATWPTDVRRLAQSYMKDPIQVNVGSLDLAAVHTVTQKIVFAEEDEKEKILFDFLVNMHPTERVIIFCGKKATASHIYSELACKSIPCESLHGDRDQSDREAALNDMVEGNVNILVATDVASRGIDIIDLTHVINFDFPRHIEEYVHRIGRTGRAGRTGTSISYISRDDWVHASELIKILEEANQEVPDELRYMAQRFEAMKTRREANRGRGGGRGRGRGRQGNYF